MVLLALFAATATNVLAYGREAALDAKYFELHWGQSPLDSN
jgi:hypothetical protein